jgi:hypothetical protein
MSDFAVSWTLSRHRFVESLDGLDQAQLNWRMQPNCLTLAEMALHVAGVEVSFVSQLLDLELDERLQRIRASATDGVTNDKPFPFTAQELTPDFIEECLDLARHMAEPVVESTNTAIRTKEIVSALGPTITGEGAIARMAFHPAYHQGQAYLIRNAPSFPRPSAKS